LRHVTVGDLIALDQLLWAYCTACGRERDLDPRTLCPSNPINPFRCSVSA
jgi:hypothetical protein